MNPSDLAAVVVTFHPQEDVLENLAVLRSQVQTVVVVDNGSSFDQVSQLREASERMGFRLIVNGCNLGIASALNAGLRQLIGQGAGGFVLLFDQDSRMTPGFAHKMLAGFGASLWGDHLGLLAPHYIHRELCQALRPNRNPAGGLEVAMTSGSMIRLKTLREHGLFVEEMFIDGVDHEYCLRLRRAGYEIDECPEAVLLHAPGSPTRYNMLGKRFQAANYSPSRRYYQERNKLWIYRRYFLSFPQYCRRLLLASLKDFGKIVLVEQDKWKKVCYFLLGVWHGLLGRMGPIDRT